jgi:hypothetical protein
LVAVARARTRIGLFFTRLALALGFDKLDVNGGIAIAQMSQLLSRLA